MPTASNNSKISVSKIFPLVLLTMCLFLMVAVGCLGKKGDNEPKRSEPAGQVVGYDPEATLGSSFTALMLRLKFQPSQDATLEALAQEACAVQDLAKVDEGAAIHLQLIKDIYEDEPGETPIEVLQEGYC